MGISQLWEGCRECPYCETCDHKRLEALAYLPEPAMLEAAQGATAPLANPLLRETIEIRVEGKPRIIYKEEIEKALYAHLYAHLGLLPGA